LSERMLGMDGFNDVRDFISRFFAHFGLVVGLRCRPRWTAEEVAGVGQCSAKDEDNRDSYSRSWTSVGETGQRHPPVPRTVL